MNPTEIDAIQARWDVAQKTLANDPSMVSIRQLHRLNESATDVPALLALMREQAVQMEGLRTDMQDAMADAWDEGHNRGAELAAWAVGNRPQGERPDTDNPYRAALTATEGA